MFDTEAVVALLAQPDEIHEYLGSLTDVERVALYLAVLDHIEDLEDQLDV